MRRTGPDKDTNMQQNVNLHCMHSDRVAMIASESNSPTSSHQQSAANPTPFTPEEVAARKARMNADLIEALKSPCPPGTTPYIIGIGLYTHVEGPPRATLYPDEKPQPQQEFLPVRIPKNGGSRVSQPDELVRNLWEQLEKAVEEEEEIVGKTELGLKELKKRYGGLDPPKNARPPLQYAQQQHDGIQGDVAAPVVITTGAGNMNPPANGRTQSLVGGVTSLAVDNEDVSMGGTEVE
ncbi:hypothetical protein G6011_00551 [Alternaria panax]|uniref:Uncharacterized protein n=1 Tax=Alternaria panax TaxID=48097 RepID=A0AAD4NVV2_9PLEO|nr:hypothetical protein G6011_00551 [Alternaria panax]